MLRVALSLSPSIRPEFRESEPEESSISGCSRVRSRDGLAVWSTLRLVISSAWRLFEEFPGLGWEAWVECPTHVGQLQHYLAGVGDTEVHIKGLICVKRSPLGRFVHHVRG